MRDVILYLAEAPEDQIDPKICERLRALAENPTAKDMKTILDDCAYSSLASDFAMMTMDVIWKGLIAAEEGKA